MGRNGNVYLKSEVTVCMEEHSDQLADAYEQRAGLKPYTKKFGMNASEVKII
jgi:hypothetical protein